ncbi:preprotein translocase subunit SecA [Candidatus Falkowbacteria bacterium CG_4_10_14_0_2_um_filter_36_22]|uniref:Protein translocase subunit SecA n=2 Tax=Candidatus Falkowiibacteriota TaxID=1752728 RepID=A0A1J4T6D8_9BACT|nr:MAG: preprotein translocase subunit SecA [Candidatus Falkowbacteria bacterium CG1_02_37_44]PIV50786.1 MAG: preprotein translocase subunit SecA [Candidatus Falkowbacteria bacterium CG02_land_8_20_14_3_00_36_14]PJA10974.1 MAG: preprotein translocase subunit SecA [Candidatus Falkowbacteria bacterium CG_4_10_14_0_2_um_filter_36_22]
MSIITKIFGDPNEKYIKTLRPLVDKINSWEDRFKAMSDEELKGMTAEFRKRLGMEGEGTKHHNLDEELKKILPEAFAVVREASRRTLGQRHYDVQLIGGIALHQGQIAEMRTGEGKTLVATLPLYLNALAGRGAHLVTVNDYLSRIGAGWMAPVYHLLGLSVGVIIHDSAFIYDKEYTDDSQFDERLKHFRPIARKDAYARDILYGTNNEFGFDYLRDNMAPDLNAMVQRGLHYAIVDEIDSILIDEARTPLIISAAAEESTEKYFKFAQLVERLQENVISENSLQSNEKQAGQGDYNVDEKMRVATLTEVGIAKMEKWLGVDNIYTAGGVREAHHIEQALKARVLFKRDRDYVIKDGQVIIVDEFTGRLMHGRRYSEGLHQAIEAKEGVKVQRESQTLATITFQNYFRIYKKLAGMTGTAATEAEEFSKIYNLETVVIPTHKPMVRKDLNDLIYRTEEGKFKAVIEDVKSRHRKGQPVLVGTISIEKNEILSAMMEREGLRPQVLNAKNHLKEAQIITQAGKIGSITIATNMAGRGVDIMLGGNKPSEKSAEYKQWLEEHNRVKELGGLHVIGTERHESRRIDNQLRGRSGRQGDQGSSQFYVSTEDDLMRIFGGDRMKSLMATLKMPEDMPIENKIISKSIESAQKKVEGNNFDIRKHLVEYDDVLNKHRDAIYKKRRQILKIAGGENYKFEIINPKQIQNSKFKIQNSLSDIIIRMVEAEIEQVVSFHTVAEKINDWDLNEIKQVMSTIFPIEESLDKSLKGFVSEPDKLDKVKARTAIIEYLADLAKKSYKNLAKKAEAGGINWAEIAKAILIRSIDTLWVEHLEAMTVMRQGIGLRGYGQRDPLVEYKKEAYGLYNELNNLINKEVVYSIYKVGQIREFIAPNIADRAKDFIAPAKTMEKGSGSFSGFKQALSGNESGTLGQKKETNERMDLVHEKVKDASGKKVGRNDPCPCGSGKKFKKCHGG